jgi:NADH-quinone oxidoreductase subunit M
MLSVMIFLPLISAVIIGIAKQRWTVFIKIIALLSSCAEMILSLLVYLNFKSNFPGFQFERFISWIPAFGIGYHVGIDGISLPLVILSNLLIFVSVIISLNLKERPKEYFLLFMILNSALVGVFCSLDLFLFYIFWELVLIPMYFVIGIWGHENKRYAAFKFIIYTACGSVFMLIGILCLYFYAGSFDLIYLMRCKQYFSRNFQYIVYLLFFLGFAVKVPIFPLHTWLPDAHVEAPTTGSVILAGILLKMGTYGFLRVMIPLFKQASIFYAQPLAILALINVIYGAFLAMAQKDLKRLVAYSSISHMGYVMLGIASLNKVGLSGALLQIISHGIITPSLFMLVGIIYDKVHKRTIDAFGGIGWRVPIYTGLMAYSSLASLGLPGLSGFISEFLCFVGGFKVYKSITILCIIGIVITAWYMLSLLKEVFMGKVKVEHEKLQDVDKRELLSVIPLQIPILLIGIYPACILNIANLSIISLLL